MRKKALGVMLITLPFTGIFIMCGLVVGWNATVLAFGITFLTLTCAVTGLRLLLGESPRVRVSKDGRNYITVRDVLDSPEGQRVIQQSSKRGNE